MYGFLAKRYKRALLLLAMFLLIGLFVEMKGRMSDTSVTVREEFEAYLEQIRNQEQNAGGISIFGGNDSYNMKKIHMTAKQYETLEGIKLSDEINSGAGVLVSDYTVYLTILLFGIFIVYVMVYDKDKGYDALIQTLKYGNRKYVRQKLFFILITIIVGFGIEKLVKLTYVTVRYGTFQQIPIQSLGEFQHVWLRMNVYEFFILQMMWQTFWLICFCTFIVLICQFLNRIWKSMLCMVVLILGAILIHLNQDIRGFGPIYQLSSDYWKELSLVQIEGYPVNGIWIALLGGTFIFLISNILLTRYGDRIQTESSAKRNQKKSKEHNGIHSCFYYEWKKIMVVNRYWIVLLMFLVFQVFHYGRETECKTSAQYYYQQYMGILEGSYSEETWKYMNEEEKRYEEMENRIEELHQKASLEGLQAKESVELQKLQRNLEGKYGFQMTLERIEHVKKNKEAKIFDDLALQRLLYEDKSDSKLDLLLGIAFTVVFAGLLCFEERVYEMNPFLNTMPEYALINQNKRILLGIVCGMLSCLAMLPKLISLGIRFGYHGLGAPAHSIIYFPQVGLPIWSVLVICFLVYYMLLFIVGEIIRKVFQREVKE